MLSWLWLEPVIPFVGSLVLLVAGRRMGRRAAAWLGTGSIAASTVIAILITIGFVRHPPVGHVFSQRLWSWFALGSFHPQIALYLDPLAVVMTLTVAFVSFLIHLYSVEHMRDSEGYERFFAYMNLFVASMLTLVLAQDLLLLFLGWEGVGLCSYLLIGFWYQDEANGLAARKAFIVTRVGDAAFTLGLLLLAVRLGTLDIQPLMHLAAAHWPAGSAVAEVAALLLLGGAVGKSAQLPLQTWLPDAMAGPTPTSALIHAATMVTAGVYLIARTHVLFELAPVAQLIVLIIGLATLLLAGCSALVQHDIKRILAYSTISQIGYMFLALGLVAWSAAIFHLVTHAFFKALLFLAAGVVIQAMHEEHDIFKMGGLRERMPLTYWCFIFAGGSLAGLPLVSAGFYSKGLIIWSAWTSPHGNPGLWAGALLGAFLTALYIFRLIFVVFHGEARREPDYVPGVAVVIPLAVLAWLSMLAGFFNFPGTHGEGLSRFLLPSLPGLVAFHLPGMGEWGSEGVAAAIFFIGVYLIYRHKVQEPQLSDSLARRPWVTELSRFWYSDWGMDWLYERIFVHPVALLARINRADAVDKAFDGVAALCRGFYRFFSATENGRVRWYAAWVAGGAVVLLFVAMLK